MALQFSKDGKYFAYISTDGKLKIWDTVSNNFEQEFTPDYHLTSPCTCLHFLPSNSDTNTVSIKVYTIITNITIPIKFSYSRKENILLWIYS